MANTTPFPGTNSVGSSSRLSVLRKREEKLLDKYSLGKVLGQGAFGVVYSCRRKGTGEEFAVKMIDQVETPVAEIKQEVDMLKMLAHPCVVRLHDVFYEKVFVCMVMEVYKGGDMIEGMQLHWKARGMIAIPVIQNLSKMMFQGIEWLHQNSVVHRDLKGDNYLQDVRELDNPQCRVFLSDFGTVMNIAPGQRITQKCGTKTYWAPEFYQMSYGMGVDIWALGVIIYGMITGRFPFKGQDDVMAKAIKIPSRLTKEGESFLIGMLTRDEGERLTAKHAMEHPFLASIVSSAEAQEPILFKPEVKESGANAGIQERRKELVERLENAANKNAGDAGDVFRTSDKLMSGFEVEDKRAEKRSRFEWWTPQQIATAKFVNEEKARAVRDTEDPHSEGSLATTLENHNIQTSKFGQGSAKTFREFETEICGGKARMMLDAAKHKCLVRVVDLVLLRIVVGSGSSKQFLVKTAEKYPDGRMRSDINQLPGTKKLPHENGMETAYRMIQDRLRMIDCGIKIEMLSKECFEDDEDSPSYPGVRTVYRKEIFEGVITVSDPGVMVRLGLGGGCKFAAKDEKGYTHYHQWMSEHDCVAKKVTLRAPTEDSDVSALVFPPIGLDTEELTNFLTESTFDINLFGKDGVKTLQEFSEELVKGESALVRRADGSLIRIVDVLILKVTRKDGSIVVETSQEMKGVKNQDFQPRLPAVKRRSDENMFLAAHRVMSKVLKIDQNLLAIDPRTMTLVEEESRSKSFGDLPTLYRRRIVNAKLNA